jgi:hypothetical protein
VRITTHAHAAAVTDGGDTYPLAPTAGRVRMDEAWAPHVQGSLTIPLPDALVQGLVDPRESGRVSLSSTSTPHPITPGPVESITFDLGIRERRINHQDATLELELASDEAILQDDVLLDDEPDLSALDYQSSLRDIINNVILSRIGATLEPGGADAPFRVLSDSTNLIPNPSAEVNTTGVSGINSTLSRVTDWAADGAASFKLTNGTSSGFASIGGDTGGLRLGMQPGRTYTFSATVRLSAAQGGTIGTQARKVSLVYRNSGGTYVEAYSPAAPNAAGVTRLSVTVAIPLGATEAFLRVFNGSTAGAIWIDAMRLSEVDPTLGADNELYFDGDSTDTAEYGYAWTGTPHNSTSTREALISRSPDLLKWEPGVSAWDFVQPLFQAAGLRLFCDHQRTWRLVDSAYIADGATQLSVTGNAITATDTISRDADEWYDAALAVYTWRDADGITQRRYDFHAAPGHTRVRVFEIERAYPGPGVAEYAVKVAEGRGREVNATAVSRYTVRPSQPVTITLPDAPVQTGAVSAVEFNLDDDRMSIRTRGLTDTPPEAWLFLPVGEAWQDSPIGEAWNEETV